MSIAIPGSEYTGPTSWASRYKEPPVKLRGEVQIIVDEIDRYLARKDGPGDFEGGYRMALQDMRAYITDTLWRKPSIERTRNKETA